MILLENSNSSNERKEYSLMIKSYSSMLFNDEFMFNNDYEKVIEKVFGLIWRTIERDVHGYKIKEKKNILKALIRNLIAGLYYGKVVSIDLNSNVYHNKRYYKVKTKRYSCISYRLLSKILQALISAEYIDMLRGYWNSKYEDALKTRVFATDKFCELVRNVELEVGIALNKNIVVDKHDDIIFIIYKNIRETKINEKNSVEVRGKKVRGKAGKYKEHILRGIQSRIVKEMRERVNRYNEYVKMHKVVVLEKGTISFTSKAA